MSLTVIIPLKNEEIAIENTLKYFEESYNKYTSSEYCISSESITDSIKLYYINQFKLFYDFL